MLDIHMKGFSRKDGIVASFHNRRYSIRRHIHQYSELVYILDGEFTVITEGKREIAGKGDIVIIPPYQPHSYCTEHDGNVHFWMLLFSNSLINDMIRSTNSYYMYDKNIFKPSESLKIFIEDRMIDTNEMPLIVDDAIMRKLKGLLYPVFDEYLSKVELCNDVRKGDAAAITIIMQYISQHYHENITLEEVCNAIGYSRSYISHILKSTLAMNFRTILNSFRINYARNLLINTNMKSFNIAVESGFESERTFHRVFKEVMEITPSDYRKKYVKNK